MIYENRCILNDYLIFFKVIKLFLEFVFLNLKKIRKITFNVNIILIKYHEF